MRIGSTLFIVWLAIGALAGGQRHYYSGSAESCVKAGTIAPDGYYRTPQLLRSEPEDLMQGAATQ
jgi:hypothetical protein